MLGKIVYNAHLSIGKVLHDYRKLKAIESIEASSLGQLPKQEFIRLIDTLIDNHEIKSILLGQEVDNNIKAETNRSFLGKARRTEIIDVHAKGQ